MRLIINCDPENVGPATLIIHRELKRFDEYNRVGYGWTHNDGFQGERYFVKRIRDGLSIKQIGARLTNQPAPAGDAAQVEREGSREANPIPTPTDQGS